MSTAAPVSIRFGMTTTQALELAEGISLTAGAPRDDLGVNSSVPDDPRNLLFGSLCLITHAANVLAEFVEGLDNLKGGSHE